MLGFWYANTCIKVEFDIGCFSGKCPEPKFWASKVRSCPDIFFYVPDQLMLWHLVQLFSFNMIYRRLHFFFGTLKINLRINIFFTFLVSKKVFLTSASCPINHILCEQKFSRPLSPIFFFSGRWELGWPGWKFGEFMMWPALVSQFVSYT